MSAWEGKICLITGGAGGIGEAVAKVIASKGGKLFLSDLDGPRAEKAAEAIRGSGGKAESAPLDVTNAEAVKGWVEGIAQREGRIDFIFNNAGIAVACLAEDHTLEDWNRTFDVNLRGVVHGVHAAYPIMIKQGHGQIANTASLAGLIPAASEAAYAATKFAVVGLSTTIRAEAMDLGVKVNAVCPGFVDTAILFEHSDLKYTEAMGIRSREETKKTLPVRVMPVDEAARKIVRGFEKNRAIIPITPHAWGLWMLMRICPPLVIYITKFIARDIRKRVTAAS